MYVYLVLRQAETGQPVVTDPLVTHLTIQRRLGGEYREGKMLGQRMEKILNKKAKRIFGILQHINAVT